MRLEHLTITDFRCLGSVELELAPHYNLIVGPNASGKTSLLEAIAYLGRGKSFRGAAIANLLRRGSNAFVIVGRVAGSHRSVTVGVRSSRSGLEAHVDGASGRSTAALAELLPLQVIDPEVHALVAGGPEGRRRFLDWLAFHVEHGFLDTWRRYRRSLAQRNAALRDHAGPQALQGWNREFCAAAEALDGARRRVFEGARTALEGAASSLLETPVTVEYLRGWGADRELGELLTAGLERDRLLGATQTGPQRGELRLVVQDRQARGLVSRGQQKLLACGLILGGVDFVQGQLDGKLLLLLDDPAAELDRPSQQRLMARVAALGCQVVATALEADPELFPEPPRLFHVEQGTLVSRP